MALSVRDFDYQVKLIGLMILQPDFIRTFRGSLYPELFDEDEFRIVVKSILSFYDKYFRGPDYRELAFWISERVVKDPAKAKGYSDLLSSIQVASSNGDLTFVYDHFQEFVASRVYFRALSAGLKAWEKDDFLLIPEIMRQADKESIQAKDTLDYFGDPGKRIRSIKPRQVIPTGIQELDDILGGGPARKELTVVVAPTGGGKTTMLINMGAGAVVAGYSVVHMFIEQTTDIVAGKYDSCFSSRTKDQIMNDPDKMISKLETIAGKGGNLVIEDCGNYRIDTVRGFLYKQDRVPDVLIIDYADKIVSSRAYNNRRHEIALIYDELIRLCKEFNCAVYTASQTNKGGLNKEQIQVTDVDEAFDKSKITDNLLALCQTEKERKKGDMRIFTAKVRNEVSQKEIGCKVIFQQCTIMSRKKFLAIFGAKQP
jgi:replicative DNA helicase